jgi:hypothetical protein
VKKFKKEDSLIILNNTNSNSTSSNENSKNEENEDKVNT